MIYKRVITPIVLVLSFSIFYINFSYAGGNDRGLAPVEMLDTLQRSDTPPVVEQNTLQRSDTPPVVEQKVIVETPPVVREIQKPQPPKPDLSEKPVGHPTGPVEDVGEKIYKNCDELSASNSAYKYTCIFLLGVFSIL